jgi:hypothetical protein
VNKIGKLILKKKQEFAVLLQLELGGPKIQSIKTNEEFMTKYKAPDIVNVLKIRRLERLGHVVRINETDRVCKEDL